MSDDHQWNDERPRRGPRTDRQARTMSEVLRESLREVGIEFDEAKPGVLAAAPAAPKEPNREMIRDVLVARGARDRDVSWLTASCPSLEAANEYEPPKEQ